MPEGQQMPVDYDYIIAGAGCAGLSLAVHLLRAGALAGRRLLLVDRAAKDANDRTWCFWQTAPGLFEAVVHRQWQDLRYYGQDYAQLLDIRPYTYKMIRGIDFYRYCQSELGAQPNIDFLQQPVEEVFSGPDGTGLRAGGRTYRSHYVFNSIPDEQPKLKPGRHWLLQHFKGWRIRCPQPCFDPERATLMDFRIPQDRGTAFCYVLPFSAQEALVEYTLFTASLLQPDAYDAGLRTYIARQLGIDDYTVEEEEFGIIPMTDHHFDAGRHRHIRIGTAGGQTKGSSGYTFSFIQKQSAAIAAALAAGRPVRPAPAAAPRFHFYDSVLLGVLAHDLMPGHQVFTDLFRHNPPARVLRFLDNDTRLPDELRLISTLPTWPFLRSAVTGIVGRMK